MSQEKTINTMNMQNINLYDDHLKEVVLLLVLKYRVDYIFVNNFDVQGDKTSPSELFILISNKETRPISEVDLLIKNDLKEYESYHYLILNSGIVKEKIERGNLFLYNACHPGKLVLKNPSCSFQLHSKKLCFKERKAELQTFFDRESYKMKEFKDGYNFYRSKGNLSMATFMLHQTFELRYRCVEILTLGKEKYSHSIRAHHNYLGKITKVLNMVFCDKNDNDNRLISLLNDSYCAARYEEAFLISEEDLNTLETKVDNLISITDKLLDNCLSNFSESDFEDNHAYEQKVNENNLIDVDDFPEYPYLQDILTKIKSHTDIKEIYLISYREQKIKQEGFETIYPHERAIQYVLLLVGESNISKEVVLLQNHLNGSHNYFVQLLGHSKFEVETALKKKKRFFTKVLKKQNPIFTEGERIKWLIGNDSTCLLDKAKLNKLKRSWEERRERAEGFIDSANTISTIESIVTKGVMYSLALEQIFIGLLDFFYDYRPQNLSVKHVFSISAGIWKFPNDIFPNSSTEEKILWKIFSNLLINMRLKPDIDFEWNDLDLFHKRCDKCLKQASVMVEEYCEKFKKVTEES